MSYTQWTTRCCRHRVSVLSHFFSDKNKLSSTNFDEVNAGYQRSYQSVKKRKENFIAGKIVGGWMAGWTSPIKSRREE